MTRERMREAALRGLEAIALGLGPDSDPLDRLIIVFLASAIASAADRGVKASMHDLDRVAAHAWWSLTEEFDRIAAHRADRARRDAKPKPTKKARSK